MDLSFYDEVRIKKIIYILKNELKKKLIIEIIRCQKRKYRRNLLLPQKR